MLIGPAETQFFRHRGRNGQGSRSRELYVSAPSWNGKWLSALLRAAGHPRPLTVPSEIR